MKILVVYATTEGQTRKIARFAANRLIDAGASVEVLEAGDAEGVDPVRFDGAILGGSLHLGGFQIALARYAGAQSAALNKMPTLFLTVSLTAAGGDKDDWAGLEKCVAEFLDATEWKPGRVEHVAGAFRFGEYDFFKAWAMRWIARERDSTVKPGEDKEYTDWKALAATLDQFLAGLAGR